VDELIVALEAQLDAILKALTGLDYNRRVEKAKLVARMCFEAKGRLSVVCYGEPQIQAHGGPVQVQVTHSDPHNPNPFASRPGGV